MLKSPMTKSKNKSTIALPQLVKRWEKIINGLHYKKIINKI